MESTDAIRIVLLGKTGTGKSSLANTILNNEDKFTVNHSANSETKDCKSKIKTVNKRSLHVTDTPGFFDTDLNSSKLKAAIVKCMTTWASAGPHAFVLVLKVEKYTKQEKDVIETICSVFSDEVYKYTTVVFTHGDQLPDGMKIEEWVSENKDLSELVQKCGGRCHVIDNKYWKNNREEYRNNQFQVEELLKSIDKTVTENDGGHYTNEMLQSVNRLIQQEDKSQEKAQENIFQRLWSKLKSFLISDLLGALFGVVKMVFSFLFGGQDCKVVVGAAAAAGAVFMGAVGGDLGHGEKVLKKISIRLDVL